MKKSELRQIIREEIKVLSEASEEVIKKTKNHEVTIDLHNGKYTVLSSYYDKEMGWIESQYRAKDESDARKVAKDEAKKKTLTLKVMGQKSQPKKKKPSNPWMKGKHMGYTEPYMTKR